MTDVQIERVKNDLNVIINGENDSVLLYIARDEKWLKREHLGKDTTTTDNLLQAVTILQFYQNILQ